MEDERISAEPDRLSRPPYVGHRGWIGLRIGLRVDGAPDWDEVAALIDEAYPPVALATLIRRLGAPGRGG